jgi:bifunctional UDP-N-acetylglucosamine pyrophosphorylase/glucosamine-1-phosphate N-acetyltransferase
MQTVLLAAGDGAGMEPLSSTIPKPLLPVGGDPLLVHVARRAVAAGATKLVVVVPPYYQPFTRALGDDIEDVPVTYAVQPRPMGTANALVVARSLLDDDFVVLPGDTLYDVDDLTSLYASVPTVAVSARGEPTTVDTGSVVVGDGGPLDVGALATDSDETYVGTGACSLPHQAKHWTRLPPNDEGERDITGIVERTAETADLRPVLLGDYVDVDHPWELLEANDRLLDDWAETTDEPAVEGAVDEQARLHGHVRVDADATVAHGAVVEGPAIVAAGATIEPNAYVRPYTYVGPNVTVGHGTEVRRSILLDDAHVDSNSVVVDSILGPRVHFAAGTRVEAARREPSHVIVDDDVVYAPTTGARFGVVAGEGASTSIHTNIDAGSTLARYATVDAGGVRYSDTQ